MLAPGARAPACYDVRRGLTTNDSSGDVAKVVANAMITIIENSTGDRMPRSRPMLRTTSSTSPRVFSRMPICNASAHVMPVARAATAEPIPLPATATASISTVSPTSAQSLIERQRRSQAARCEEERQEQRGGDWFDAVGEDPFGVGRPRHDDASEKRAEERVDTKRIGGVGRYEYGHEHDR